MSFSVKINGLVIFQGPSLLDTMSVKINGDIFCAYILRCVITWKPFPLKLTATCFAVIYRGPSLLDPISVDIRQRFVAS